MQMGGGREHLNHWEMPEELVIETYELKSLSLDFFARDGRILSICYRGLTFFGGFLCLHAIEVLSW